MINRQVMKLHSIVYVSGRTNAFIVVISAYERGNKKASVKHRSKWDASSVNRMCFFLQRCTFNHGFLPKILRRYKKIWMMSRYRLSAAKTYSSGLRDRFLFPRSSCVSTAKNCNTNMTWFIYSVVYDWRWSVYLKQGFSAWHEILAWSTPEILSYYFNHFSTHLHVYGSLIYNDHKTCRYTIIIFSYFS